MKRKKTRLALQESEKQRQIAQKEKLKADTALVISENQKAKNQKLVNAFYFYENKFALAFNGSFYFIDKEGNQIKKLGEWKKAEQFSHIGLAKVWKGDTEFGLDTLGNIHYVAYQLKDLNSKTTFLNLEKESTIANKVFQQIKLQFMILHGKYFIYDDESNNDKSRGFTLSDEIINLQELKYLEINNFKMDYLSPNIGKLKKLVELDLTQNHLKELPTQIGELTNLKTLNLLGNELSNIPIEISQLKALQTLEVSQNKNLNISTLCNIFKKYHKNIKISTYIDGDNGNSTLLFIRISPFTFDTKLPTEIGDIANLTELNLKYSTLETLPSSINNLHKLEILNLRDNRLRELSPLINNLKNIKELHIGGNRFSAQEVYKIINLLPNLEVLDIGDLALIDLPMNIFELKKLKKLILINWNTRDYAGRTYSQFSPAKQQEIRQLLPNCKIIFYPYSLL